MTVQYDTMPREGCLWRSSAGQDRQELQVLYVAHDQGQGKAGDTDLPGRSGKKPGKIRRSADGQQGDLPLCSADAGSFSDWILSCALRHPGGGLREKAGASRRHAD